MTAYSLGLALKHDCSLDWPASYTGPLALLTWLLYMTDLFDWLLIMTAHSLGLALVHDCSLPWPGSYTCQFSCDLALKHDSSLSLPGSYTSPLTLFAWHLCMTAHSLGLALKHDAHSLGLDLKHDRRLPWPVS